MACEIYGYNNFNNLPCFIYYNDGFCFFNRNVKAIHAKT